MDFEKKPKLDVLRSQVQKNYLKLYMYIQNLVLEVFIKYEELKSFGNGPREMFFNTPNLFYS